MFPFPIYVLIGCIASARVKVNMVYSADVGAALAHSGMTSAHGRCHTFDARADGYVRAEACCTAAIVPSDDKESDGQAGGQALAHSALPLDSALPASRVGVGAGAAGRRAEAEARGRETRLRMPAASSSLAS